MTAKTRHVKARAGVTSKRTTSPVPGHDGSWRGPGLLKIRDVSLFVDVIGHGYPLLLMHGGPSLDHWSLMPFRQCAGQFTLIFYDHRCNGRSAGAPVSSMTLENLTADAEALRQELGFERWAVLGHSFGGHVALEYALRYPASLSHLVLLDTGGDAHWARQNAPDVLASRGYSPKKVELVRRWFTGEFTPHEYVPMAMRIAGAYSHRSSLRLTARGALEGGWRTRYRPQALIFAGRHLLKDWTVMDRLGQITVPTLVLAGRDDFIFPPECQRELAAGIPHARLQIIDRAGHNPHAEQTAEVMAAVRHFLSADTPTA
jgi:proline iminopeptidase